MNLWVDVKVSLMHVQLYEFFIRRIPKQIQIIASGSLLLERSGYQETHWKWQEIAEVVKGWNQMESGRADLLDTTLTFISGFQFQGTETTQNNLSEQEVCWKDTRESHTPNIRKDSRVSGKDKSWPLWVSLLGLQRLPSLLSWMAVVWLLLPASWFPHAVQLAPSLHAFSLRTGSSDQFRFPRISSEHTQPSEI